MLHDLTTLPLLAAALLCLAFVTNSATTPAFDHNSQHCHDVSVWGDVVYRDEPCTKCSTEFEKDCEWIERQVCADVPSLSCKLVPYTNCTMFMEQVEYNETEIVNSGVYHPIKCFNETKEEAHIKMVPRCIEVERQDCVTKWILTATGEKIWDGNEQCTPVKWNNCTLQPEEKLFNQTFTTCKPSGPPIPTMECRLVTKTRMVNGIRCEVKHNVHCDTTSTNECMLISYQECRENPRPTHCNDTVISRPFQPRIHRVKCLLANENVSPNLDLEKSAAESDEKLILEGGGNGNNPEIYGNHSDDNTVDLRTSSG